MPQFLFHHFGHLRTWGTAIHAGVHQVEYTFGQLTTINVDHLCHILHSQDKTAAEFTRFSHRFCQFGYALKAGNFVTDKPHSPVAVLPHTL
ncbi:hypothetical protein SDC9_172417 [bioreactor metagenome]|uniref:Uncharacterized protein n=1 Tax=bioreactor metagenome TaxID=1076179 RepID=A0A645GFW7_9ZZZZ